MYGAFCGSAESNRNNQFQGNFIRAQSKVATMSLPPGWESRTNQMSEHDIKLGGVAATKFATSSGRVAASVEGPETFSYKSSDEVRQLYLKKIDAEEQAAEAAAAAAAVTANANATERAPTNKVTAVLPSGWEDRQKAKAIEQSQYGAFGRKGVDKDQTQPPAANGSNGGTVVDRPNTIASSVDSSRSTSSAETTLVRVAIHTLQSMASALERNPTALTSEDRAAFAVAMKRALGAVEKCPPE